MFLSSRDPLCFEELLESGPDGAVRDISAWLGHAIEVGFIEEVEDAPAGQRCFRLRARGHRILTGEKRGRRILRRVRV